MAFYGLTDEHLLRMPINRFWLLESNIQKLQAERDIRQMRLLLGAQSTQTRELAEQLSSELGTVVIETNPDRDVEGIKRLKQLAKLMGGS